MRHRQLGHRSPHGSWSPDNGSCDHTPCHAPLASPSGHNMSPAHYDIIMSVNMATQSPGPEVAMFPHVPDRSLGFSFDNVLRPRSATLPSKKGGGRDGSSLEGF